jgi:hypothetical protein
LCVRKLSVAAGVNMIRLQSCDDERGKTCLAAAARVIVT